MRSSGRRLFQALSRIREQSFLVLCQYLSITHFTRCRKLPLTHLILSLLDRRGLSLSMEIRRFFRLLTPDEPKEISPAGYLKQRQKLNPYALLELSRFYVRNFYAQEKDTLIRFKGHYVLAVDGSSINLPTTPETQDYFGFEKNQAGIQVQARISCLYDVCNKMILDLLIDRFDSSERDQAEEHIRTIPSFLGDEPVILILDRGYPSSFFFMDRLEAGHRFVARLSSATFRREQQSMRGEDEEIEVVFTPERINPYRHTPLARRLRQQRSIRLRFVKVTLPGGVLEYLATNLPKAEFSAKDISTLYELRWRIETAYDTLKNKYQLENFTSRQPVLIEQDILAALCLYNMVQDMIRDAQAEQQEKNRGKPYRYEMAINGNLALGVIKEDLIRLLLERSGQKKTTLFEEMIQAIAAHIVPVREHRQYSHKSRHPALKHPMNKKRSY